MSIDEIDDERVRSLVNEFLDLGDLGKPFTERELRTPWGSRGACSIASGAFAIYVRNRGLEAWRPSAHTARPRTRDGYHYERPQLTPETFGLVDRLNRGFPTHYWTCIEVEGLIWGIDLTAAQYGYAGPLARMCSAFEPQVWAQRLIWRPQVAEAISEQQLIANRVAAGASDIGLNTRLCQMWRHPDGRMRYATWFPMHEDNMYLHPHDPDGLLAARRTAA